MARPPQGLLDLMSTSIVPATLPVLPGASRRRRSSRGATSASTQHADLQSLLVANENLHQQLLLALQRLAEVYLKAQQHSHQRHAAQYLDRADEVSEDIARWESGAPALLRADGTLQNDNATSIEIEFDKGPLGLLFRAAPEDTGYALEVHEFVHATPKSAGSPGQQQVIPQLEWAQRHSTTAFTDAHVPGSQQSLEAAPTALQRGMVLIAVQGKDVFRVSPDTVGDMLESASRPLLLKFALFPLSTLRRAYQALQSRFTTLQVRVEVMHSTALQREEVYQSELFRMKAQLRVMACAWRQASGSAADWQRSALTSQAQVEAFKQQISSLEKRILAPQDRLKAMVQREGTAPLGAWSPDSLVRQASTKSRRPSAHELGGGVFRDLDAPQHAKYSFDSMFSPPPPSLALQGSLQAADPPDSSPRLRAQHSTVPEGIHTVPGHLAGTMVGDSLLLLKARLSQLAGERDTALRSMADSQEQLMHAQERLRAAEEQNRDLQEEMQDMHSRSGALVRFAAVAAEEQRYQDEYVVKLAQNGFNQNKSERPHWNVALLAMKALWEDFTASSRLNLALRKQLSDVQQSHAALQDALSAVKRKLVALRANNRRSGAVLAASSAPPAIALPPPHAKSDSKTRCSPAPIQQASTSPTTVPGASSPAQLAPNQARGARATSSETAAASRASSPVAAAETPHKAKPSAPPLPTASTAAGSAPQAASIAGLSVKQAAAQAEAAEMERVSAMATQLMRGSAVVLEAPLFKRSRSGPKKRWSRWVSRYVRLNRSMLSYYLDDAETRPKGTINIGSVSQVSVCPAGSTGKHTAVFQCMLSGGKEVQFSASDTDTCHTWREVLGEATVLTAAPTIAAEGVQGGENSDGTDSDAST